LGREQTVRQDRPNSLKKTRPEGRGSKKVVNPSAGRCRSGKGGEQKVKKAWPGSLRGARPINLVEGGIRELGGGGFWQGCSMRQFSRYGDWKEKKRGFQTIKIKERAARRDQPNIGTRAGLSRSPK